MDGRTPPHFGGSARRTAFLVTYMFDENGCAASSNRWAIGVAKLSICQEISVAFVAAVPQRCGRSLTEPPGRPKVSHIGGDLRSVVSAGSETRAEQGSETRAEQGSETRAEQCDCYFLADANEFDTLANSKPAIRQSLPNPASAGSSYLKRRGSGCRSS